MDILSIIEKKKLGRALTKDEIKFFVRGAADQSIPDYQLAALLMAIRLNGMTNEETTALTLAMAESGDMLHLDVGGTPVDKHSTGGVGDTTTLILVPLCAACGAKVAKMSGRALGHTGGTVDKMESIPHMRVTLSEDEFIRQVRDIGCVVVGQSAELAPADKRLYALRDVTGTVDSVPLIASSILSKKFASGARGIVLDVKTGSGAIMETEEDSIRLAQTMVGIGENAGRHVTAIVTGMQEPLGSHVGNALEVKEAIDILAGRAKGPLLSISLLLGAHMLMAANVAKTTTEAEEMLKDALSSGRGLAKLRQMITAQGGDARVCDDVTLLPQAKYISCVKAEKDGYIAAMDTAELGLASQTLGAGRKCKEDQIDYSVGFVMHKRIGEKVNAGDTLFTIHSNDKEKTAQAEKMILSALSMSDTPCVGAKSVYAVVTKDGVERM